MEALFLKLVNMSITASWLVLAVLVFRLLLKKAPKYIHVILWGLVGVRLVFPFSIESVLSLIPSAEPLPEEFLYAAAPQINSGIPAVNNRINPIIAQSLTPAELTSANPTQIWSFIFAHIWLIGVTLMVIYALISFLLIRRKVAASIPVGKNIRLCDHIDTPFILGIVNPRIYLPSSLDQRTADHVLAHEYAHLRRRDHWWKPLGFLLLSVYWFNPVMWLAYILLCRDIEMACDEKVVKELNQEEKKSYSTALLACSVPRRMIAACPLAFGEVGVKKRIKSVLNYKKPAFWIVAAAVILCIVVALCFLTDPTGRPLSYLGRDNLDAVEFISIDSGDDNYVIVTESEMDYVMGILDDIRISRNEISQSRSEDRDSTHTITLHYEKIDCKYCFNADLTEVWYDNSVKPSLTHEVMNPDQARALFLIAAKAPETNRLPVGSYHTAELVYWPPYSSYFWENDPNYQVQVSEDGFDFTDHSGRTTVSVDWGWKTVAECAEELIFFFDWHDELNDILDDLPSIDDDSLYQKITNEIHLFQEKGVLYLVKGSDTGTALTNVSAIYRLERSAPGDLILNPDTAFQWAQNVASYCNTIWVTCRDGETRPGTYFLAEAELSQLFELLKAVPEDAFVPGSGVDEYCVTAELFRNDDKAGDYSAQLRYHDGKVDLALISETTQVCQVLDDALITFMEGLFDTQRVVEHFHYTSWEEPVTCSHGYASITLTRMVGWEYEIVPYTDDATPFGIRCRPEWEDDGWVFFCFYPEGFGVCGTGLETKDDAFLHTGTDLSYTAGYYDENDIWSYICFNNLPGAYVILNEGADKWLRQHDHMDAMISENSFGAGIINRTDVIEISRGYADITQNDTPSAQFDYRTGIWTVLWNKYGSEETIRLQFDHLGNSLDDLNTVHPSVYGTMEMEIKEASFYENAVVIGAVIKFPEDLPVTNGLQSLSPREVLLYRGGSGTPIKVSSVSSHSDVVDNYTADFRFLFDLSENELTESQFLVTIGDFRYAYDGEKVTEDLFTISWGIPSLGEARTFAAPGDSKDVSVSISEIYIEANVYLPEYTTTEDVYSALKFYDAEGNEIPLPTRPNSGSIGGEHVKISICPTEPWGAEDVATVMLGDTVLWELVICQ